MYNRSQVFIAACLGLFIFGMTLITLGSILPELKESYSREELKEGTLTSILPIGILLGSLVFGPIVDRYGYKFLLITSVIISAASLCLLAMTKSPTTIYICIFLIGFGGGVINGGTSALVSDISSEDKAANLSLLGVFFGVGAFGLPFLLAALSKSFSYDQILFGISLAMFLPVIWYLFIRFPKPKLEQGFPLKQGLALLKEGPLLITAFFLFFQSATEALSNNWTTSFLQSKLDITQKQALFALSFSVAGFTVARLILAALLRKISSFIIMVVSLMLVVAGNLIMHYATSYNLAFGSLLLTGMGLAGGFPVMLGYIGQLYAQLSGTAFSILLVIALIGNTFINFVFGELTIRYSIDYLPFAIILCTVMMLILLFIIRSKLNDKIKM